MKQGFVNEVGITVSTTKIFVDNQAAIKLSQTHQLHSRTKHIDVKVCFVRDECEKQSISINYVNTSDQLADFLIKPLVNILSKFIEILFVL